MILRLQLHSASPRLRVILGLALLCVLCGQSSFSQPNPTAGVVPVDTNTYVCIPVSAQLAGNLYTVQWAAAESNFSRTITTLNLTNALQPAPRTNAIISGQMWLAIPVSTNSGKTCMRSPKPANPGHGICFSSSRTAGRLASDSPRDFRSRPLPLPAASRAIKRSRS